MLSVYGVVLSPYLVLFSASYKSPIMHHAFLLFCLSVVLVPSCLVAQLFRLVMLSKNQTKNKIHIPTSKYVHMYWLPVSSHTDTLTHTHTHTCTMHPHTPTHPHTHTPTHPHTHTPTHPHTHTPPHTHTHTHTPTHTHTHTHTHRHCVAVVKTNSLHQSHLWL